MRSIALITPFALGVLAVAVASGSSTRAADVSDLRNIYSGDAHHVSVAAAESENITLEIEVRQSNGKFAGLLGGVPVTGKVTPTGKVTFAGKEGTDSFKQGKAQLSATGEFLVGSFVWQTQGSPASGKYVFSLEDSTVVSSK